MIEIFIAGLICGITLMVFIIVNRMLKAEVNEVSKVVYTFTFSNTIRIEDFHIGFEYQQLEIDSERYLNRGNVWKDKVYGYDSPRLYKIKKMIDDGLIRLKQ